jgi:hypothetical protein
VRDTYRGRERETKREREREREREGASTSSDNVVKSHLARTNQPSLFSVSVKGGGCSRGAIWIQGKARKTSKAMAEQNSRISQQRFLSVNEVGP